MKLIFFIGGCLDILQLSDEEFEDMIFGNHKKVIFIYEVISMLYVVCFFDEIRFVEMIRELSITFQQVKMIYQIYQIYQI